jgi:arginine:pyruvate transaminase
MKYADRVERWAGEAADAWEIHEIAATRMRAGEDIYLLTVGDTDFASPDAAIEEAHNSLLRGRTNYAAMIGERPLREAIAARQQQRTGVATAPEQVVVTQGAQNALYNVAQCLLDPGCDVVAPEPMYVTYPATVEGTGANLISVPSRADNNFHPTLEDLTAAITDRTRAIFLASPNNPTGAVYSKGELEAIAALCIKHDLWLVSDEVYGLLTYGVDHVSATMLDGMADRTIVISSLSKSHAMAGWRLGWAIVPPGLVSHMENLALCSTYGTPTFIQDAAVAAIQSAPGGVAGMKETYGHRRDWFCEAMDALPGLACRKPEGGMFAMLDVRGSGLSAFDFAHRLLDDQRIATLPADAFGPSAKGFLRINLAVSDDTLEEVAKRIAVFADSLQTS